MAGTARRGVRGWSPRRGDLALHLRQLLVRQPNERPQTFQNPALPWFQRLLQNVPSAGLPPLAAHAPPVIEQEAAALGFVGLPVFLQLLPMPAQAPDLFLFRGGHGDDGQGAAVALDRAIQALGQGQGAGLVGLDLAPRFRVGQRFSSRVCTFEWGRNRKPAVHRVPAAEIQFVRER
jgi:hypothetical protein